MSAATIDHATTTDATIAVTYQGFTALDWNRGLGGHDALRVVGPHGYSQLAQFVAVAPTWDGMSQVATYRVPAPDGDWDRNDNGAYAIEILPGQIRDSVGRVLDAAQIGTLWVNIDALWLTSTRVAPGQYRLDVAGASPAATVTLVRGNQAGQYPLSPLGLPLDLADPVLLGQVVADFNGQAQLLVRIPAGETGHLLGFQAFEQAPTPLVSELVFGAPTARLLSSIDLFGGRVHSSSTLQFTITFAQSVLGVTSHDFVLVAAHNVTDASIKEITGHGAVYTVTVETGTGDDTLELNLREETGIAAATGIPLNLTRNGLFAGPTATIHKTREDTNLDFVISPVDALLLINALNDREDSFIPDGSEAEPLWYDVSGDGWVSPLDALIVINYLNARAGSAGEGEPPLTAVAFDEIATTSASVVLQVPSTIASNIDRASPIPCQRTLVPLDRIADPAPPRRAAKATTDDWEDVLDIIAADQTR